MTDDQQRAREQFEAWARSKGMPTHRRDFPLSERLGEYGDAYAAKYWETWQAATAALSAAPEGFVMVPVEPTEEMIHGLASAFDWPSVYMSGPSEQSKRKAVRFYASIIAARPQGVSDG